MDRRSITSAENGKKGGRPKGSGHKPKITDHMSPEEARQLLALSVQKAMDGSETMMKFILEQFYGKAVQRTELETANGQPVMFFINPEVAQKNDVIEIPST